MATTIDPADEVDLGTVLMTADGVVVQMAQVERQAPAGPGKWYGVVIRAWLDGEPAEAATVVFWAAARESERSGDGSVEYSGL